MKVDWEKRAQTGLLLSSYRNGLVPVSTSWLRGVMHMLARERKALLGILPKCGHACAIDADTSQEARMEMAGYGYDMLTLPMKAAVQRFDREWDEHLLKCEKGGDR